MMTWLLIWLNVRVATLNTMLQFLVIYRLEKVKYLISDEMRLRHLV